MSGACLCGGVFHVKQRPSSPPPLELQSHAPACADRLGHAPAGRRWAGRRCAFHVKHVPPKAGTASPRIWRVPCDEPERAPIAAAPRFDTLSRVDRCASPAGDGGPSGHARRGWVSRGGSGSQSEETMSTPSSESGREAGLEREVSPQASARAGQWMTGGGDLAAPVTPHPCLSPDATAAPDQPHDRRSCAAAGAGSNTEPRRLTG